MDNFNNKRTIEFVLNKENGATIYADSFFIKNENEVFKYRNELQKVIKGIREPLFICYFCGQNIKINGGGYTKKVLHFAHKKDSDFCKLKTDTYYSKLEIERLKYNGAKESPLHFETKNLIKKFIELNNDFSNIKLEKVVRGNLNYLEWKKPDISATYVKFDVVFEIQLSTTFLSVIVDREYFYKENKTYILWVFKNFSVDEFKQRFTEKDVFYSNNRNAFVLDDEAINLSQQNNDLFLLCYYQKPIIENLRIIYNWEFEYVRFNQLTFNEINFKIYFFDVDKLEKIAFGQLEELLKLDDIENERIEAESQKQRSEEKRVLAESKKEEEKIRRELEKKRAEEIYNQHMLSEERKRVIDLRIIEFHEINIDFFKRLRSGYVKLSEFQRIFLLPFSQLPEILYRLFADGYLLTKEDMMFVKNEFEIEVRKDSRNRELEMIYYLSMAIFYKKSRTLSNMFLISKIERLLFSILSFKSNKVIGYKFENLIQVAHQAFSKKEFMQVFINAIESYYGLNKLLVEDKSGKLKEKFIEFSNLKPKQNLEYDEMIFLIFPEAVKNTVDINDFLL
jgi:hypothetical protein